MVAGAFSLALLVSAAVAPAVGHCDRSRARSARHDGGRLRRGGTARRRGRRFRRWRCSTSCGPDSDCAWPRCCTSRRSRWSADSSRSRTDRLKVARRRHRVRRTREHGLPAGDSDARAGARMARRRGRPRALVAADHGAGLARGVGDGASPRRARPCRRATGGSGQSKATRGRRLRLACWCSRRRRSLMRR